MMPCPFQPGDLVWAYLRYSTDDQNLDSQERAVSEWCAANQLVLGRVFRDEGRSGGSTRNRRGFLTMIEQMTSLNLAPRPVGLVLWNSARFARDVDDAQFYKAQLRRAGYRLHFMADMIPDGDEGRIVEAAIDYSSAKERKTRSLECKRGLRDRALQGFDTGGFPPHGYKRGEAIVIGIKKNGEKRIGFKYVVDADWEGRVRRAWQMRIAGASLYEIHRSTNIFKVVNSYPTFFNNLTYAGYRKCGELLVPNAHPAYVSQEDFERVQRLKRLGRGNATAPDGDVNHSRRINSPYLLSGILFCGLCNAAMVGDTARRYRSYECGRQHREGRTACDQHKTATWHIEQHVINWVADNILTFDNLRSARDDINRALSGDRRELQERRGQLLTELDLLDKRVHRLVDSIEKLGLTEEIEERIQQRKAEARQMEAELAEVEAALKQNHVEISDEALSYLAEHMREQLKSGRVNDVRAVLRAAVVRVDLETDWLRIKYAPPVLAADLQRLGECRMRDSNPRSPP